MYIHIFALKTWFIKNIHSMKAKHIVLAAAALILAGGLYSFKKLSEGWAIDVKDAKVSFDMPNGKHSGTFEGLTSTFVFDPTDLSKSVIKASVEVNTVKTDGGEKLDEHLKSADFFDAANHPTISFTADSVVKNDSGFVAMGKLAMRDSIKPISVPFKFIQDGNKATFKGSMDIFAGDFGIGKKSEKGSDRCVISIEVPVSTQ